MPQVAGDSKYVGGSFRGPAPLPLKYFCTSSDSSLESFELSRLNAISNLRKEIRDALAEWVEAEIQARLARWMVQFGKLGQVASNRQRRTRTHRRPFASHGASLRSRSAEYTRDSNDENDQPVVTAVTEVRYRRTELVGWREDNIQGAAILSK